MCVLNCNAFHLFAHKVTHNLALTTRHTHTQATLASVGSSFAHKFSPAPFTAATDAHLVNDAESRSIMIDHATADDKKAKFLEEFEKVRC